MSHQNLLVCICIPHYNNESTISETLDSLLNQTYKNIVIKIFDNCSTDNSITILKKYEEHYSNIQVYQNEANIGGEANFTKCIEGLEGDFGAIYHADDLYDSKIIETQVNCLVSNNISAVFVRANLIDANSNKIGEQFFPDELKNKEYYQFNFEELFKLILKYDNFLITPSVMARVDIYKNKITIWNGDKFKTSADLDVWLRFSEIENIGIITDKLISYRMSSASFSYCTKYKRLMPRDMFLVIDYYLDKYANLDFDKLDYKYLKFKDNIIVIGNKVLNNQVIQSTEIKLFDLAILYKIMFNKKKIKIYLYAMLLKILLIANLTSLLLYVVKKANNIPLDLELCNE